MGISTLDFINFWRYLAWYLYSMKLKRVNDLLIVIDLIEIEIIACARKVHRSYALTNQDRLWTYPENLYRRIGILVNCNIYHRSIFSFVNGLSRNYLRSIKRIVFKKIAPFPGLSLREKGIKVSKIITVLQSWLEWVFDREKCKQINLPK